MIDVCLADEPARELPPDDTSSKPASEYLGRIGRWHVYFLASARALTAWPTAKEDIQKALARAAEPPVSLMIELERSEFTIGEPVTPTVTIRNRGPIDISAPETYWSLRVVLDGIAHERAALGPWNGPGIIIPDGSYAGGILLGDYGIQPADLKVGEHTIALEIGEERSNERTFLVRPAAQEVTNQRQSQ